MATSYGQHVNTWRVRGLRSGVTSCPTNHCECQYMQPRLLLIEQDVTKKRPKKHLTFLSGIGQTKAEMLNPLVHFLTRSAAARLLSCRSMKQLARMLACRPLQWQSSLLRPAVGNTKPADLIRIGWWIRNSAGGCTSLSMVSFVLFVLYYVKNKQY